jgi:hypothetical protein
MLTTAITKPGATVGFDKPLPGIRIDGRRQFRGEPQLTEQERATLSSINRFGLLLVHVNATPTYLCNGIRIDKRTARRLIDRNYILPNDDGLFENTPQSWRGRCAVP